MANIPSLATNLLLALLRSNTGLPAAVESLIGAGQTEIPPVTVSQIRGGNISTDLVDRSQSVHYPQMYVYCEKLTNRQQEKFRKFSGTAQLAVEVRVSQEKSEGIEQQLQLYVEAVVNLLEDNRGEWQEGIYFGGGYEVTFGSVRLGGKSFVQSAKVVFDVSVSQG
jgi:hypothetical protein